MSLASDHRVLELSSQAALLERMSLLTNFGSNFIHVTGEAGAGKTWLAQRYLEVWAEDKNQSLLLCYHNQADAQRRQTILSQLRSNVSFDANADLVDSFYEIMDGDSCNIVIVVDDAQKLSEVMLTELWMLVNEAQSQPNWSISVVLFALPNLLDRLLGRLSYGQEQKPIDLEIETLPIEDADRFFEFSVMRFIEDDMERRVRIAYSRTRKIPGEIMALGEQKMEKRIIIRSIVGSPINIAIVLVLIALAIGGGYWWLLNRTVGPDVVPYAQRVAASPSNSAQEQNEETAIPTLNADASSNGKPNPNADDDSNSLPPAVVGDGESVGVDDDGKRQRVVITSDVVDALLDSSTKSSQSDDNAAIDAGLSAGQSDDEVSMVDGSNDVAAVVSAEANALIVSGEATAAQVEQLTQAVTSVPALALPAESSTASAEAFKQNSLTDQDNEVVDSTALASASSDERKLLAMPGQSYTLQLAAFTRQRDVDRFLRANQLDGTLYVYKTVRGDVTWLIVTYENFTSLQQARDAVDTLPDSVRALSPWAKSLRRVSREIELGK